MVGGGWWVVGGWVGERGDQDDSSGGDPAPGVVLIIPALGLELCGAWGARAGEPGAGSLLTGEVRALEPHRVEPRGRRGVGSLLLEHLKFFCFFLD